MTKDELLNLIEQQRGPNDTEYDRKIIDEMRERATNGGEIWHDMLSITLTASVKQLEEFLAIARAAISERHHHTKNTTRT